jgi:hypothetical protein
MATSLAEVAVSLARNAGLSFSNWLDRHLSFSEQVIEASARDRVTAAIDDGCRFDIIDSGNVPMGGFLDCLRKIRAPQFRSIVMIADVSRIIAAVPSRRTANDRDRWIGTVP